jgi:hypothetical protein
MQRIALYLFLYIFWRARVCWPLVCLGRPFYIFERCLYSNPESWLSKQARYQHIHPSPYSTTGLSSLPISRRCIPCHKLMSTANERRELNAGSRRRSHAAVSSRLCGGRGTPRLPGRAGGGPARPPAGGRDHPPPAQ